MDSRRRPNPPSSSRVAMNSSSSQAASSANANSLNAPAAALSSSAISSNSSPNPSSSFRLSTTAHYDPVMSVPIAFVRTSGTNNGGSNGSGIYVGGTRESWSSVLSAADSLSSSSSSNRPSAVASTRDRALQVLNDFERQLHVNAYNSRSSSIRGSTANGTDANVNVPLQVAHASNGHGGGISHPFDMTPLLTGGGGSISSSSIMVPRSHRFGDSVLNGQQQQPPNYFARGYIAAPSNFGAPPAPASASAASSSTTAAGSSTNSTTSSFTTDSRELARHFYYQRLASNRHSHHHHHHHPHFMSALAANLVPPLQGGGGSSQSFQRLQYTLQTPEQMVASRRAVAAKVASTRADTSHNCAICLDEISLKVIIRPCFHQFCHLCLFEWFKGKNFCPVCRQEIVLILYNITSEVEYEECSLPMWFGGGERNFDGRGVSISINILQQDGGLERGLAISAAELRELYGGSGGTRSLPRSIEILADGAARGNSNSIRLTRVILIQLLAVLQQQHPTQGYPTRQLTFDQFSAAAGTVNWSNLTSQLQQQQGQTPSALVPLFRAYLYLHNYRPQKEQKTNENGVKIAIRRRDTSLEFIRENQVARDRLVAFLQQELDALGRAYALTVSHPGGRDGLLRRLQEMLTLYELCGPTFRESLRELLASGTNLGGFVERNAVGYDVLAKVVTELIAFARSAVGSDQEAYLRAVTFVAPGVVVKTSGSSIVDLVASASTSSVTNRASTINSNSAAEASPPALITISSSSPASASSLSAGSSPPSESSAFSVVSSASTFVVVPGAAGVGANSFRRASPTPSMLSSATTVALGDTLGGGDTPRSVVSVNGGGTRASDFSDASSSHIFDSLRRSNHVTSQDNNGRSRERSLEFRSEEIDEHVARLRMATALESAGSSRFTAGAAPTKAIANASSLASNLANLNIRGCRNVASLNRQNDLRSSDNNSRGGRSLPSNSTTSSAVASASTSFFSNPVSSTTSTFVPVPSTSGESRNQPKNKRPIELITLSSDSEGKGENEEASSKRKKLENKSSSSSDSEIEWIPPVGVPENDTANIANSAPSSSKNNENNGGQYINHCQPSTSKQATTVQQQQHQFLASHNFKIPLKSLGDDEDDDDEDKICKQKMIEVEEILILDSDEEEKEKVRQDLSLQLKTDPSPAGSKRPRTAGKQGAQNSTTNFKRTRTLNHLHHRNSRHRRIDAFSSGNIKFTTATISMPPGFGGPSSTLATASIDSQRKMNSNTNPLGYPYYHHRRRVKVNSRRAALMEMRRVIRASARGNAYHHRVLMKEVRRKYCLLQQSRKSTPVSILNDRAFAHLEPVFVDLYLTSKVLPPARSLAEHVASIRGERPDYARLLPPGVLGPCTSASTSSSAAAYEALQRLTARQIPPLQTLTSFAKSKKVPKSTAREFLSLIFSSRPSRGSSKTSKKEPILISSTEESEVEKDDDDEFEDEDDEVMELSQVDGNKRAEQEGRGGVAPRGEQAAMDAYESSNRLRIGEAAIQHLLTPSGRRESVALVKRAKQGLPFVNHLYSEED